MKYKFVGKPYIRPDAISKVTGKAIYLDDVRLPGMLYRRDIAAKVCSRTNFKC